MNKALTIACTAVMFGTLLAGSATSASAHAPCGTNVGDMDGSSWPTGTASGARIRTGSSIDCTAVGTLEQGQRADYHCYTVNHSSGYSWTYLRNVSTGKTGWVRDDLLPGYGSHVHCGF